MQHLIVNYARKCRGEPHKKMYGRATQKNVGASYTRKCTGELREKMYGRAMRALRIANESNN